MGAPLDRRAVLKGLAAAAAALTAGGVTTGALAGGAGAAPAAVDPVTAQTLEAFADTIIPGERRYAGDRAVAGAVSGPGAVQAGALDVLASPELPLRPLLPGIAALLTTRATAYAATHLIVLPPLLPPFVGLSFAHRTALVGRLYGPEDADRAIWQVLALVVSLAFDTAANHDTAEAVRTGHPGLTWLGFPAAGADGVWRFDAYSYGRSLAPLHPSTTPSGSPA
ncbi:DUF5987 family protein [Streptomyces sp. NPDC051776]|uniref:DUF5987 family protein n=1 Tax=Streptomyces sp. NPDC051776 TaxID=3155414 RepID=UPI00341EC119